MGLTVGVLTGPMDGIGEVTGTIGVAFGDGVGFGSLPGDARGRSTVTVDWLSGDLEQLDRATLDATTARSTMAYKRYKDGFSFIFYFP